MELDVVECARMTVSKTLPNKAFSKVFCIGANKTGTTTLYGLMQALALNVASEHEQQLIIVKQLFNGNYEPFKKYVDMYDVFQDVPFSLEDWYIVADVLFPNSKFILTMRDPEQWYDSLCNFHKTIFEVNDVSEITEEFLRERIVFIYKGYVHSVAERGVKVVKNGKVEHDWSLLYDKDHCIKTYMERNERIIKYFEKRPEDLLILNMAEEKDTSKIVKFLGFPDEVIFNMPHLNKTDEL